MLAQEGDVDACGDQTKRSWDLGRDFQAYSCPRPPDQVGPAWAEPGRARTDGLGQSPRFCAATSQDTLSTSQLKPVQPLRHSQWYCVLVCQHLPPFLQGAESHQRTRF